MIVAEIKEEKAKELQGSQFAEGQIFNPVIYQNKWVISLVEAQYLSADDIVSLLDYVPINEDEL